jgi:hypothetical protein
MKELESTHANTDHQERPFALMQYQLDRAPNTSVPYAAVVVAAKISRTTEYVASLPESERNSMMDNARKSRHQYEVSKKESAVQLQLDLEANFETSKLLIAESKQAQLQFLVDVKQNLAHTTVESLTLAVSQARLVKDKLAIVHDWLVPFTKTAYNKLLKDATPPIIIRLSKIKWPELLLICGAVLNFFSQHPVET